jgi:hypothetical protein
MIDQLVDLIQILFELCEGKTLLLSQPSFHIMKSLRMSERFFLLLSDSLGKSKLRAWSNWKQ